MATDIRRYVNSALGKVNEPMEIAKDTGIGVGVGLAAGLVASQRKGGLDSGKAPLDIAAGGIGMLVSAFAPLRASTREMVRTASSNAIAIGTFRKVQSSKSISAAGEGFGADEDPIVKAARAL